MPEGLVMHLNVNTSCSGAFAQTTSALVFLWEVNLQSAVNVPLTFHFVSTDVCNFYFHP